MRHLSRRLLAGSHRSAGRLGRVSLGLAALLLSGAVPVLPSEGGAPRGACPAPQAVADESTQRPACCFKNPAYVGVCTVQPAEKESCGSILAYLNDPQSQGKDYCGNTTIRGGWTQVDCPKTPAAAKMRAAARR
jgi:hypothetical protein